MNLNLQLNTQPIYNRDMVVELTNQATGQIKTVKPYLDGSVVARDIDPGQWRVAVKHPNILFNIFDRPVRVFPDRPTFVPITIPETIFRNTPVAETPDANLSPVRSRLDEAEASARTQGAKRGGEPIYADDWNDLAATLAGVARASSDLAGLVSPVGHDHPELVAKINEVQGNLQRFYDLFGRSLAQLQRQVQQLALQRKVEAAVGDLGAITPAQQGRLDEALGLLNESWRDPPPTYMLKKQRAGRDIDQVFAEIIAGADAPQITPAIEQVQLAANTYATEVPASDFASEIEQQQRFDSRTDRPPFQDALGGFQFRPR